MRLDGSDTDYAFCGKCNSFLPKSHAHGAGTNGEYGVHRDGANSKYSPKLEFSNVTTWLLTKIRTYGEMKFNTPTKLGCLQLNELPPRCGWWSLPDAEERERSMICSTCGKEFSSNNAKGYQSHMTSAVVKKTLLRVFSIQFSYKEGEVV